MTTTGWSRKSDPRGIAASVETVVGSRWLDQPVAQREGHRLELRVHPQLAHDVLDVRPERVWGDEQLIADLRRRQPFSERAQDLQLARRERLHRLTLG